MNVLNLYSGVGGNRRNWPVDWHVTAVDNYQPVLDIYEHNFPLDTIIMGDCRAVIVDLWKSNRLKDYDLIWSSPPCQSHSKMVKATRHKVHPFPDLTLYEEVIFYQERFAGAWVVENVHPYYKPLIPPTATIGRHLFWSSARSTVFSTIEDVRRPANFINTTNIHGMRQLQTWLGIHYDKPVYYHNNHCPCQIYRNAVHPQIGYSVAVAAVSDLIL